MTRQARQTLQGWGVAGPIILYFTIFSLIPLGMVFYYCFTDWDGLSSTWDIVGFENFKKIYSVNVFGTFLMMHYTLPIMVEQNYGRIVNFGSVSGMTGYTFEIGYGSSKWAVIGMTKNVANEYGQYNIHANSVSPGWVDTPMFWNTLEDYKNFDDSEVNLGPLGRPSRPDEIADVVYYLCTDEAFIINGSNVLADGGKMLG